MIIQTDVSIIIEENTPIPKENITKMTKETICSYKRHRELEWSNYSWSTIILQK